MNILFISYKFHPDVGGIEVNSEILAQNFSRFGANIKLVTTSSSSEKDKEFDFPVYRKPSKLTLLKLFVWADVIYENNPSLTLSWPNLFFRKRHVIALRTWVERVSGEVSIVDKFKLKWLRLADDVIAVSSTVRDNTFKDSIVIGNPYRNNLFNVFKEDRLSNSFVFLGRLVSDKGADMAVDLIARLNEDEGFCSKSSLTVIGDGEELCGLKNKVRDLGLEKCVKFTGVLKGQKLVDELNNHKYLLVPSRWKEPFGNLALEGMACGCLPIVSDGGGLVDAVGEAGVVFKRNNIDSMFEEVSFLLRNPKFEFKKRLFFRDKLLEHRSDIVSKKYYDVIAASFSGP